MSAAAPPPPAPAPGHRDMMFCHECQDEWYRDMHGLTCPECGSDFTEIIEENNDPRDHEIPELHQLLAGAHAHNPHNPHDTDDESMPDLEPAHGNVAPHVHNNPFAGHSDDPDEADISGLQFRELGPGRFAVTGTIRNVSPPAPVMGGAVGGLMGLLGGIIGGARPAQPAPDGQHQGPEGQGTPGDAAGPRTYSATHRFAYTPGARLQPRDPNNPGPHIEPTDELNNVLVGLMAAFGEPPGHHHHHHAPRFTHDGPAFPANPLFHLFAHMMPGNGQVGDAVYSQEALDRIITQLMEQNASSNAPGPAPQDAIANLPKKPVAIDMLGPEGHAECSICMEEVNIGEEVAFLPCTHWFHHPCISAWLGEHDTCPHCRKGIAKDSENAGNQNQNQNQSNTSAGASASYPMPGSFATAGGEGTASNPYTLPTSPPPANSSADANSHASAGAANPNNEDSSSGGGIGERIRRGLFGP